MAERSTPQAYHAAVSLIIALSVWYAASRAIDSVLLPDPVAVLVGLFELLSRSAAREHVGTTLLRGVVGSVIGLLLGTAAGVVCGQHRQLFHLVSPLVAALQACPMIIWIVVLMVWFGTGSEVPIAALILAVFPLYFVNCAGAVQTIEARYRAVVRMYRVPLIPLLTQVIGKGIKNSFLAATSLSLAVSWKVLTMAEFIAADSGIGAQVYWAYRNLDMPLMFAWAALVVLLGLLIEALVVGPLRPEGDKL